jgi:hypothetical protein
VTLPRTTWATAPAPRNDAWTAHLDAVEQWVRAVDAALTAGETTLPAAPVPPVEPLPADLTLRAHGALAHLGDLVGSATRRRGDLDRRKAYDRL